MPVSPKVKITEEMVIHAAFELTRADELGVDLDFQKVDYSDKQLLEFMVRFDAGRKCT